MMYHGGLFVSMMFLSDQSPPLLVKNPERFQAQAMGRGQVRNKLVGHLGDAADVDHGMPLVRADSLGDVVYGDPPALEGNIQTLDPLVHLTLLSAADDAAAVARGEEQSEPAPEPAAGAEQPGEPLEEEHLGGVSPTVAGIAQRVEELDVAPRSGRLLRQVRNDGHERVDADAAGDEDDLAEGLFFAPYEVSNVQVVVRRGGRRGEAVGPGDPSVWFSRAGWWCSWLNKNGRLS